MLYQLSYTPKLASFCRIATRGCKTWATPQTWRSLDFAAPRRQFPPAAAPRAVGRKDGMRTYLSFETAVADIDARLDELRAVAEKGDSPALAEEIARLEARADKALADLYANLTPWQKTQVARVQGRPRFGDYVKGLITEFTPSPATAISARTRRSSAASEDSRANRSASSGRRRATTRQAGCSTISAWRGRKAIARRCV